MLDASKLHKVSRAIYKKGFPNLAHAVSAFGRILFSAHVPPEAEIGPGVEFGYGGIGVVIHRGAVIGKNVLISPGVVIGGRSELPGAPVIEDEVKIGAGAKVLGPIRIGKGAKIGANAVVIHDVAPGDTVAGIPARPLHKRNRTAA
jgi:serine O-acetyltransferase